MRAPGLKAGPEKPAAEQQDQRKEKANGQRHGKQDQQQHQQQGGKASKKTVDFLRAKMNTDFSENILQKVLTFTGISV